MDMRKKMRLLTCLMLLLGFTVKAQETTSEILGSVTDAKGGILAGATVTALHEPTNTRYSTTTRKDGRYNLPGLRVGGPYKLTTSFVGFKEESQDNIVLSLGQGYKGDFKLTPTEATLTEVVVSGIRQNRIFNTNHTGSVEIINRNQIDRMPSINRSLNDLVKLTPSANGLSFGGGSSAYNSVTLDGASFSNSFGLGTVGGILGSQTNQTPISLDAIEQLQVNISPFDTRNGGFAGAGINAVTRSGTNQFKGSVYTYIKGGDLQGYNVAKVKLNKQTFEYNQRGASIGGPIIKNKLFFFISGEQVRQTAPATLFSASSAAKAAVRGSVSQANADTLAALASFLQSKFGYDPGAYEGYSYKTQSDKIAARFDWNINKNSILTVKYNFFKSRSDQPPSGSGPSVTGYTSVSRSASDNAMPFANVGYGINNNFNIAIAELNTRFSNKLSNKFQIGYTAIRDFRTSPSSVFPLVDILSLNPSVGTASTSFGYEQFTYGNKLDNNVFQFSDIVSLYTGSHEITMGTQNYFKNYVNGFAPQFAGIYQFATLQDFYNSVNNGTGSRFYSRQYSAVAGADFPYQKSGSRELSLFVQDKWRLTNNFTLLYGIRLDHRSFKSTFYENANFATLSFGGKSFHTGQKPKDNLAISPRLGFNWDVKGDKSIQLRGGLGIFSGPPPFVWFSNQVGNNGALFGQTVSYTSGSTSAQPFDPNVNIKPPTDLQVPTTYVVNITDPEFKYPSVLKSTLGIDTKLPGDIILTLEGTYSKDINAVYFQNINLQQAGGFNLTGYDNRIRYATPNNIYPGTGTVSATNPKLSSVIFMTNTNHGYSYTATAQVQKSFKNLFLTAAYTHSKSVNTNELGTTAASLWGVKTVVGDPNSDIEGFSSYYLPHRIIASATYRVEYAKHFATSIGLIYEAAPSTTTNTQGSGNGTSVTSYTYNGDLNNDGQSANDLIYIPASKDQINLVKSGAGGAGTGTTTDTRTTDEIWDQLNSYIGQDDYLKSRRGKYAERNAVVLPFNNRLDLNFTQDFYMYTNEKTSKTKHTLRLTVDIFNFTNLINKYWGIYKTPTLAQNNGATQLLRYEGLAADGKTPSFSFPYYNSSTKIPLTSTYTNNTSLLSRWQMQIGIRYLFN